MKPFLKMDFFCLFTVTDVELKRLKDAFKRTSGLSAYMTQQCFYKEVLGDGVPPKVAEVIRAPARNRSSLCTKNVPASQPTCSFQSLRQPTSLLVCHCCKCFVNNKLPAWVIMPFSKVLHESVEWYCSAYCTFPWFSPHQWQNTPFSLFFNSVEALKKNRACKNGSLIPCSLWGLFLLILCI